MILIINRFHLNFLLLCATSFVLTTYGQLASINTNKTVQTTNLTNLTGSTTSNESTKTNITKSHHLIIGATQVTATDLSHESHLSTSKKPKVIKAASLSNHGSHIHDYSQYFKENDEKMQKHKNNNDKNDEVLPSQWIYGELGEYLSCIYEKQVNCEDRFVTNLQLKLLKIRTEKQKKTEIKKDMYYHRSLLSSPRLVKSPSPFPSSKDHSKLSLPFETRKQDLALSFKFGPKGPQQPHHPLTDKGNELPIHHKHKRDSPEYRRGEGKFEEHRRRHGEHHPHERRERSDKLTSHANDRHPTPPTPPSPHYPHHHHSPPSHSHHAVNIPYDLFKKLLEVFPLINSNGKYSYH
ncbi:unnamed protein product [Heterobilharzia americana]|nr:unnamed protein product [Heterobilharzia americana]CAH8504387.1 unnamed protein product [Heterobilharzia americana]